MIKWGAYLGCRQKNALLFSFFFIVCMPVLIHSYKCLIRFIPAPQLLHCITKLFNLPITFEHLQETGIGKTVNALRKINGEVGVAAKTLVTKWKAMVAAEEEPAVSAGGTQQGHSTEEDSYRSNGRRSSDEDQDQENKGSNSSGGDDDCRSKHKSKQDEHHSKSKSSSGKSHSKSRSESDSKRHKSSSSSEDKSKSKSTERHHREHKSSSSSSKPKESVAKHQSSSNLKTSSSSGSSGGGDKQRHHSSNKKSEHSSHKSEHSKSRQEKKEEVSWLNKEIKSKCQASLTL